MSDASSRHSAAAVDCSSSALTEMIRQNHWRGRTHYQPWHCQFMAVSRPENTLFCHGVRGAYKRHLRYRGEKPPIEDEPMVRYMPVHECNRRWHKKHCTLLGIRNIGDMIDQRQVLSGAAIPKIEDIIEEDRWIAAKPAGVQSAHPWQTCRRWRRLKML